MGRTVDCRSRGRWSSGKNSRLWIERTVVQWVEQSTVDREDGGLVGRTVDCRSRGRWSSGKNSRLWIERTVV